MAANSIQDQDTVLMQSVLPELHRRELQPGTVMVLGDKPFASSEQVEDKFGFRGYPLLGHVYLPLGNGRHLAVALFRNNGLDDYPLVQSGVSGPAHKLRKPPTRYPLEDVVAVPAPTVQFLADLNDEARNTTLTQPALEQRMAMREQVQVAQFGAGYGQPIGTGEGEALSGYLESMTNVPLPRLCDIEVTADNKISISSEYPGVFVDYVLG